ncbi:hypothetical protein [Alkaliphilus sp. B6464]|uniref:hypothetical protein n=1 Tax=Alkaliphilus sp. B6464 TaxID=2731219 RepID=UPI001BA93621|nr:hypothetical protein [Alkaliphilus sp. B6464]QUH20223.1 hypothetical protein HYG84_10090 [Alkaliphilus sp. B6464]
MKNNNFKYEINKLWEDAYNWILMKHNASEKYINVVKYYELTKSIGSVWNLGEYKKLTSQYEKTILDYEEMLKKIDRIILNYSKKYSHIDSEIFMYNWVIHAFVNAVMENSNFYIDKQLNRNYSKEREEKNKKMICIFRELMEDADYSNFDNNLKVDRVDNKIIYSVKNIPLFSDILTLQKKEELWHGTTLFNAISIIQMDLLKSSNNISFNKNKIFFSDNVDDSISYGKRWSKNSEIVLFKFDLSNLNIYKREHTLVSREGNLYFIECDKLNIKDYLKEVYLVDLEGNVKKISMEKVEEIAKLKNKDCIAAIMAEKMLKEKGISLFHEFDKMSNIQNFNTINSENLRLYHSTSIENYKKILMDGIMKPCKIIKSDKFNYGKIFLSDDINYARNFGRGESAINKTNNYIMLEIDLTGYDVFVHYFPNEYFVIGDIKADAIKKIYRFENDKLIDTLDLEE